MSDTRLHQDRGTDGFAVVAVLWIVGALATLAAIYAAYLVNTTQAFAAHDDRIRADAAISAAVALTAGQMNTPKDKQAPRHGGFSFRLDRAHIQVAYLSEDTRIDLNAAPKPLLAGLFSALGAPADKAKEYADDVIAWRTLPETSAADKEVSLYRAAGLSYDPRQAPFASTAELWLVRGLPPSLVSRALAYTTVFSGQASIDVMNAPAMVIAALPGMTPERLAAVLRQRQADPQNEKAVIALLGPQQANVTRKRNNATRIAVQVRFDDGRRVNAAAVIALAKGNTPYRVLSWRDDLDGPFGGEGAELALR